MGLPGLVISKLAIEASVNEHALEGLLCIKVSLPREVEAQSGRWPLFQTAPPKITSTPEIYPLPLTPSISARPKIRRACNLLAIPTDHHSPSPTPSTRLGIDVAASNVYLVLDGGRRRRDSAVTSSPGLSARREWLVLIKMEHATIKQGVSQKLHLPIPKCLDNTLRLQIIPPHAGPSSSNNGEVDIITDPKILPLPAGTFSHHRSTAERSRQDGAYGLEDGWEDGETTGPEDFASTDEESDEAGGWLEGRFQGTDTLKLEWSFSGTSSVPLLHLEPDVHSRRINFSYEATVDMSNNGQIPLGVDLPPGWGMSELDIQAEGLNSWRCVDDTSAASALQSNTSSINGDDSLISNDESFTTLRPGSPRSKRQSGTYPPSLSRAGPVDSVRSSASLRHQTLPVPDVTVDDFSFEMSSQSARPHTHLGGSGGSGRKETGTIVLPAISLVRPVECQTIVLVFDNRSEERRAVSIQGRIAPVDELTLVSTSTSVPIPRFQLGETDQDGCLLSYPSTQPIEMEATTRAVVQWHDSRGRLAIAPPRSPVDGQIRVGVSSDNWGILSMMMAFDWPRKAQEVEVVLPDGSTSGSVCAGGKTEVRVKSVSSGGQELQRTTVKGDEGWRVVLGRPAREGEVRLVLEMSGTEGVVLPVIPEGGDGEVVVTLQGDWGDISGIITSENISRLDGASFVYKTSSTGIPSLSFPQHLLSSRRNFSKTIRAPGMLSWTTLFLLFTAYVIISLAQRNQRLGHEIAFVKDELRDLREVIVAGSGSGVYRAGEGYGGYGYGYGYGGGSGSGSGKDGSESPGRGRGGTGKGDEVGGEGGGGTDNNRIADSHHPSSPSQLDKHRPPEYGKESLHRHGSPYPDGSPYDYGSPYEPDGPDDGYYRQDRSDRLDRPYRPDRRYPPHDQPDRRRSAEVGRVVLGKSTWEQWVAHPTVRSLRDGIRWVWGALVWLIDPTH